jgi:hypothetical protein
MELWKRFLGNGGSHYDLVSFLESSWETAGHSLSGFDYQIWTRLSGVPMGLGQINAEFGWLNVWARLGFR